MKPQDTHVQAGETAQSMKRPQVWIPNTHMKCWCKKSRDSDHRGKGWEEMVTVKEFWQLYKANAVPST